MRMQVPQSDVVIQNIKHVLQSQFQVRRLALNVL